MSEVKTTIESLHDDEDDKVIETGDPNPEIKDEDPANPNPEDKKPDSEEDPKPEDEDPSDTDLNADDDGDTPPENNDDGDDVPEGKVQKLDEEGNKVVDEEGNPVYEDAPEITGIEAFLSRFGIEGGMIEFESEGEEGNVRKHFDDLTEEEKGNILLQLAESGATPIEQKYDLDEDEIGFLNFAREKGKPISDVVEELALARFEEISKAQATDNIDYTKMSDEDLYTKWLKESNADASEEDIATEVEAAKSGALYESKVERIRSEFIDKQKAESTRVEEEAVAERNKTIEEDRATIVEAVRDMDDVVGFTVDDNEKNAVLEKVLELGDQGDSVFMEDVFGDPKNIFKAAFLYYKGEDYLNAMEDYYKKKITESYVRGKREAIDGMPSKPTGGSTTGGADSNKNKDKGGKGPRKSDPVKLQDLYDDE